MKKLTKEEIASIIKKNWLKKSFKEISQLCGITSQAVRGRGKRMGLPPYPTNGGFNKIKSIPLKEQIEMDKRKAVLTVQGHDKDTKYREALKEIEKLQQLVAIKGEIPVYKNIEIKLSKTGSKNEATAVVLASDWHLEQRVDSTKIIYPNEYNLKIAEKRAKQFFEATVVLLKEAEQNVKIKNLVLWLGGDFITGNIHTENLKICQLGPAQAICFARDLLISGIEFLLKETDVDITIPYNHGNHARITEKVWKSTEEDNSLEYILYDDIAYHFKNERRIKIVAPTGSVATVEIYGLKIGFVHGHHGFRYLDGVGGLYIPARKYIMRKFRKANYYLICMGHHHQYLQDTMFLCNGSMIGYDQYADSCGFDYSVPAQTFFLIEEKRKSRTVTRPILFDD